MLYGTKVYWISFLFKIQCPSQNSSWGHINPVIADNGLFLKSISPASFILFSLSNPMTSLIGVFIGHPT